MKQRIFGRLLAFALIFTMMTGLTMPAFAGAYEKYENGEGNRFTLRWMDGLFGLTMPTEDEKGTFSKVKIDLGGAETEVYESVFQDSQGWFDLTVQPENTEDEKKQDIDSTGVSAAAANLTYWWLHQNQEYVERYLYSQPDQEKGLGDPVLLQEFLIAPASQMAEENGIYNLYKKVFEKPVSPDQAFDFFINGYTPDGNEVNLEENYKPHTMGGFFYPVFGKKLLSLREEATARNILSAFEHKNGAVISVQNEKGLRYLNLWGVEEDDGGNLSALFITDSQDDHGMLRVPVSIGDSIKLGGYTVTELFRFSPGADLWTEYAKGLPELPSKPEEKPQKPEQKPNQQEPESQNQKPQEPSVVWEAPTYEWSSDNKLCTATRKEKGGDQVDQDEAIVVAAETKAPTDQEPGVMTYTAEFNASWAQKQVKNLEIPKTAIKWNAPTYQWDESLKLCTAERTAADDPSRKETAQVAVTSKETRQPTCNEKGQITYTADFEEEWAETQEKTFDSIDRLEPIWGATEYTWSQDHKTCTATRICKNEADGSHYQSAQAEVTEEVTKKPTSTQKGETTFTAVFDVSWAQEQKTVATNIAVLDVVWGEPSYTWNSDFTDCVAVRIDQNDPSHQEKAEAVVTSEISKQPDCGQNGETTYVAEFKEDWAKSQKKVEQNIPKTEHNWDTVQYEWAKDYSSCEAVRVCKNDKSHVESIEAKVTGKETQRPTADSNGQTTYTAVFAEPWAEKQVASVWDIPKLQVTWGKTRYEWTENYKQCIATRVSETDPDLVESTIGKVTSKKTKNPTQFAKGETTYRAVFKEDWAEPQEKVVANIPVLPGNNNNNNSQQSNHGQVQWNNPTYQWNEDHSKCIAKRTQKGNSSKVEESVGKVSKKERKATSCTMAGELTFTAEFPDSWAKKQTVKEATKPLDHKLQKVEETAATAGRDGMKAHYKCTECKKLFLDNKGTQEATKEQLILLKPSVTEGFAILNGIPEKDHLVAISTDKFRKAYEENPGSQGVSISVGGASVTYSWKDTEKILEASGDSKKLQLAIYRTDETDSSLTPDQLRTAENNREGTFYAAELSYVKNGKNVPVNDLTEATLTLPYTGTDHTKIYRVLEDGSLEGLSGVKKENFVTFQSGNGLYLLSENGTALTENEKSGSKTGLIIWISVLTVSGLLCLGLAGFYLYQKRVEQQEEASHLFKGPAANPAAEEVPENPTLDFETSDGIEDPEMDDLNRAIEEILREPETAAEKPLVTPGPKPIRPAAPKAPMQEKKSTIAEKTVQSVNQKHTKV